jgi:predicted transport protein
MEDSLLAKTGKSLEHWIGIVKKSGLEKHGEIIKFLKANHDFTYGFANFVALKTLKSDAGSIDDTDLLAHQYKGKEDLKVIYDEFLKVIKGLGSDITITPKKDSVSFIRNKQFALFKPATKTRIDLGLKIKGVEPQGRLEDSGPFGTMCTHRIRLESKEDMDEEVLNWLKLAYETSL